jgi:Phospholipase_D-nuclease N-terminal
VIDELAVIGVLFAAVALISCLSVSDKRTIRRLPRALWVLVIVLVPLVGPVAWFGLGRPRKPLRLRPGWRVTVGLPDQPRTPAPDDDPDFLRSLDPPRRDRPESRPDADE